MTAQNSSGPKNCGINMLLYRRPYYRSCAELIASKYHNLNINYFFTSIYLFNFRINNLIRVYIDFFLSFQRCKSNLTYSDGISIRPVLEGVICPRTPVISCLVDQCLGIFLDHIIWYIQHEFFSKTTQRLTTTVTPTRKTWII